MSISRNNPRRRTACLFLALSAACAVFSAVYEAFSHGVWSWWMVCLALWPLLGGAVPYLIASFLNRRRAHWLARWCHGAALAVCMTGSAVKGALDIYGTSSDLLIAYPLLAAALLLAAAVCGIGSRPRSRSPRA